MLEAIAAQSGVSVEQARAQAEMMANMPPEYFEMASKQLESMTEDELRAHAERAAGAQQVKTVSKALLGDIIGVLKRETFRHMFTPSTLGTKTFLGDGILSFKVIVGVGG